MQIRYAILSMIVALFLSRGASAAPFVDDFEAYTPGDLGVNWDIKSGSQYLQVVDGIGWNGSKGVTGTSSSDTWMYRAFDPPLLAPGELIEFSAKLKIGGNPQINGIAGFQFGGGDLVGGDYYSDFRIYPTGSGWHWDSDIVAPHAVGPGAGVWIEYRSTLTPDSGGYLHHDNYRVYNEELGQWMAWIPISSTTSAATFDEARLYINIANNNVSAVDDVTFAIVPEPSSLSLIGLGVVMALRRIRR